MTIGSTHNVADYALPGYKLAASHYENGGVRHVFSSEGKPDLECKVGPHEDEGLKLAQFAHSFDVDARGPDPVADTEPAPKPAKRGKR